MFFCLAVGSRVCDQFQFECYCPHSLPRHGHSTAPQLDNVEKYKSGIKHLRIGEKSWKCVVCGCCFSWLLRKYGKITRNEEEENSFHRNNISMCAVLVQCRAVYWCCTGDPDTTFNYHPASPRRAPAQHLFWLKILCGSRILLGHGNITQHQGRRGGEINWLEL